MREIDTPVLPDWPAPPPGPVSFEAFHDWLQPGVLAEWVDGEIVLMSPARIDHARIVSFLFVLMTAFVDRNRLGEVFGEQVLMRLPVRPSGRLPDILFVSTERLPRLRETYLDGPADLIVEVVSPDSGERDYVDKRREYAAGGIGEYWIVNPFVPEALFHQLAAGGRYELAAHLTSGIYRSKVLPGFWLDVAWLWQQPRPDLASALRQLGL